MLKHPAHPSTLLSSACLLTLQTKSRNVLTPLAKNSLVFTTHFLVCNQISVSILFNEGIRLRRATNMPTKCNTQVLQASYPGLLWQTRVLIFRHCLYLLFGLHSLSLTLGSLRDLLHESVAHNTSFTASSVARQRASAALWSVEVLDGSCGLEQCQYNGKCSDRRLLSPLCWASCAAEIALITCCAPSAGL